MTPAEMQEARAMLDECALMSESVMDAWRSISFLAGRCGELPELAEEAPFFTLAAHHLLNDCERIIRAGERLKLALALARVENDIHPASKAGPVPPPPNVANSPGRHLDDKAAAGALELAA